MEKLERELYNGSVCGDTGQGSPPPPAPPPPPPPPTFYNSAQTASVTCPDGTVFSVTTPMGAYSATTQAAANALALAAAQAKAAAEEICLSSLGGVLCINQPSTLNIMATGATASTYTWTLVSGAVPTGMTFNGGTIGSGFPVTITGTPTASGSFTFGVQAVDSNGNTAIKNYTLCVAQIAVTPAGSDSTHWPKFTIGTPYNATLAVTACAGAATFAVTSGTLPDGLVLSSAGVVSGTPASDAVSETFTVTATMGSVQCSQSFTCPPAPSGLNFNLLQWTTTLAISATATNSQNTFNGQMTRPAGGNALLQFNGVMNYSGPAVTCNLQITCTNPSTFKYGIRISNPGGTFLVIDETTPIPAGVSNWPFTVPMMSGAQITVQTDDNAGDGEWIMPSSAPVASFQLVGVLTPAF
jgi:hypothetical protein